jgi:NAD(P)-dependent dehydrogenase (short-subunit alcohol dehydrogenase family)
MRLKDKLALVTGGAAGIGLAIAQRFAEEGAKVFVLDFQIPSNQQPAIQHASISFLACDVADEDSLNQVLATILSHHRIDILVNNASINPAPASITRTAPKEWQHILHNNLDSVYLVSRAAIPHMTSGGAIVNISSILGLVGARDCAAYAASKGGILALTRSMAMDYAPAIRVNCICPGPVETAMLEEYLARCDNPAAERERIIQALPMKRLGEPRDVANAALFLASDEAAWITGATFVVDGGDSV